MYLYIVYKYLNKRVKHVYNNTKLKISILNIYLYSVYLSIIYISIHLSIYLSINLSVYIYIYMYINKHK